MGTTIPQHAAPAAPAAPPSVEDIHQMTRDAIRTAVVIARQLGYLEGRLSSIEDPPCADESARLLAEQDRLSTLIHSGPVDGAQ